MEGERKSKGERGQGTGRWHTRGGRVVGGDRRIPSYSGDYRYAREDKDVDVQLLLFESFGGFGKGVREILWKATDVLQNKLTRAQYLDEVTWTTKVPRIGWGCRTCCRSSVSRSFFTRQSQSRLL